MSLKEPGSYLRRVGMLSGYLRETEKGRAEAIAVREGQ